MLNQSRDFNRWTAQNQISLAFQIRISTVIGYEGALSDSTNH
jgi:hypothetical protein